jgi:starvation-inducible DNA-binding protein
MATETAKAPSTHVTKNENGIRTARNSSFPKQLSTPTDLTADATKAITETVNPLIADAFALYVKTKNFHWHLASSHFRDYHLMFDEQADQIFATIDPLAERVRKLGGTTIRSIAHIGSLQTIADSNDDFVPPFEMITQLMNDNKSMAANMRAAHDVCDDNKDIATASLLEVFVDETERRTWFLFEASQGGEHHAE